MIPVNFPQANTKFRPPPDLDDSQCGTIHAYVAKVTGGSLDGANLVVTAWQPTAVDLANLNAGGAVFLSCIGGLPPHHLTTEFSNALKT